MIGLVDILERTTTYQVVLYGQFLEFFGIEFIAICVKVAVPID